MNEFVIEAEQLVKYFGRTAALDIQVRAGSVAGLLGVNGAGKTTLIRMLAGLIWPDAGRLRVFGAAPRDWPEDMRKQGIRASIGHAFQPFVAWSTAEAGDPARHFAKRPVADPR